jgi:hypothetical protein
MPPSLRRRIDWLLAGLLGSSALYFIFAYWADPSRANWYAYTDQSYYLAIAKELSHFTLTKDTFLFGLGYPLVGIPPLWAGADGDPFVWFNLAAFVFTAYATYRVGQRFISKTAGAVAAFALVFASPLVFFVTIPWNSTVPLVAFAALLLIASRSNRKHEMFLAVIAGALLTWTFAARYIDLLWVLPLAAVAFYRGDWRKSLRAWIVTGITALILLIPLLFVHNAIWGGPLKTPYSRPGLPEQHLSAYKLQRIPRDAVGLFVGSDQAGTPDHHRGLLNYMFWGLAAIPGAYVALRKPGRARLVLGTGAAVTVLGSLFYLSSRTLEPDQLKFGVTHYFVMFWPLVAILAATAFLELNKLSAGRRSRSGSNTTAHASRRAN